MFLVLMARSAAAATLGVGPGSTYATVQDAVDAASDGDTIVIETGTYAECVDLGSLAVTLEGAAATGTTVSNACSGDAVVATSGSADVRIRDLTITNTAGTAIMAVSSTLSLDHVTVKSSGALAVDGAGLRSTSSTVDIVDSTFDFNRGINGGHIYADASSVTITESTFTSGVAEYGGGIYATGSSGTVVDIASSTFEDNTADHGGGGMYLHDVATVYLTDVVVDTSVIDSGYGAGLYLGPSSTASITGGAFENNSQISPSSWVGGSAVFVGEGTELSTVGVVIEANESAWGAVQFANDASWTDSGSVLQNHLGSAVTMAYDNVGVSLDLTGTQFLSSDDGIISSPSHGRRDVGADQLLGERCHV